MIGIAEVGWVGNYEQHPYESVDGILVDAFATVWNTPLIRRPMVLETRCIINSEHSSIASNRRTHAHVIHKPGYPTGIDIGAFLKKVQGSLSGVEHQDLLRRHFQIQQVT